MRDLIRLFQKLAYVFGWPMSYFHDWLHGDD